MTGPKNPKDPDDRDNAAYPLPDTVWADDEDLKHKKSQSPAVLDSEDAFSGSMPEESPDIDEEMEKVGLHGDEEGVKPLGVKEKLQDEE
ncbi:hypothetical protein HYU92_03825 [Candidatus Curtissbacteria bacterium]|nr:hypothetical protein [Candidatus Curtissbacteria bacterium]